MPAVSVRILPFASDPRILTSRAALALRRGDLVEAARDLATARPLWGRKPPSGAWHHYTGLVAMLSGDLDRAVAVLAEGVGQHPRAVALANNLAAVHERQGRVAEAISMWERALEVQPENLTLQRNLDAARHRPVASTATPAAAARRVPA